MVCHQNISTNDCHQPELHCQSSPYFQSDLYWILNDTTHANCKHVISFRCFSRSYPSWVRITCEKAFLIQIQGRWGILLAFLLKLGLLKLRGKRWGKRWISWLVLVFCSCSFLIIIREIFFAAYIPLIYSRFELHFLVWIKFFIS